MFPLRRKAFPIVRFNPVGPGRGRCSSDAGAAGGNFRARPGNSLGHRLRTRRLDIQQRASRIRVIENRKLQPESWMAIDGIAGGNN